MVLKKNEKKAKKPFFFPNLRRSLRVLWTSAKLRRLFREDKGVEGCGWYARNREDFWHVPSNILRILTLTIFAPIYAILRLSSASKILSFSALHIDEPVCTPDAMLYKSPGDGQPGSFGTMGHYPRWMLKVTFRGMEKPVYKQVPVTSEVIEAKYMAISYSMSSALDLFQEARLKPKDPRPSKNRQWSLRDRKRISRRVLYEYARARVREGIPDSEEYIWLDEFCLASDAESDEGKIEKERLAEVGQLADIFRNASKVIVFCHIYGCKHTTLDCPWAKRLFTIAEILHAPRVITLTRCVDEHSTEHLIEWDGSNFKGQMQLEAAMGRQFHLSTILQHATNTGSSSWQSVIHALAVEAIRRDEEGNFMSHNYLGKALNGLLPRRARLEDLPGKDGWADLAWLLELNQGYYNTASLAAVCSINLTPERKAEDNSEAHVAGYRWWGKPMSPLVGNERLEPIATAFPVVAERSSTITDNDYSSGGGEPLNQESEPTPVLSILAPRTIRIHHTLRRDGEGLYRHQDMVGLRNLMYILATAMTHIGIPLLAVGQAGSRTGDQNGDQVDGQAGDQTGGGAGVGRLVTPGAVLLYLAFVVVVIVELLASTIYVVRDGWIFLPDEQWGANPSSALEEQDPWLKNLKEWGERQLVPRWDSPSAADAEYTGVRLVSGSLVDMQSKVYTKVVVIGDAYPDLMVMLAVHGTGITGILLRAPEGDDEEEYGEEESQEGSQPDNSSTYAVSDDEEDVPIRVYTKVGMTNVPAYVLSKSEHSGTIFIGGNLPLAKEMEETMWVRIKRTIRKPFQKRQGDDSAGRKTGSPVVVPKSGEDTPLFPKLGRRHSDVEKGVLEIPEDSDSAS